mgnify:CR=1 FL=1
MDGVTFLNEKILQSWNRIKETWTQLTKSQKVWLSGTVGLLILTIIIVSYQFSKTEYALAYKDLQPSDAASIKKYLEDSRVPYHLSPDGQSIEVPKNKVASLRLEIESQGLNTSGSLGYGSLRENKTFGMTDEEFAVKKLDMIQGELQQMINLHQAVSSSKVVISIPKDSAFIREKENATAAVFLQLKAGYSLDQAKIDTLYSLVSKSVPNLPIEEITISDQEGNLLPYSKMNGGVVNATDVATQQHQIRKQFEQDIQKNVNSILGKIFGNEKVISMAFATLNFDKKNSVEQLVRPVNLEDNRGIEISLQEISRSYTSESGAEGGIPGTGASDIPTYPSGAGTGNASSEEVERTVNFEVDRITNEIVSSPFSVSDLTISVGIEPPDPNNPDSLTPAAKEAIQRILLNVVDAALVDSGKRFTEEELSRRVTVFDHSFANSALASASSNGVNWWMIGGIGAAVAALAGVGGFLLSRRRKRQIVDEESESSAPILAEYPTIDIDNVNDSQVRTQLETLAKRKPEEFVNLLRTWLVDE